MSKTRSIPDFVLYTCCGSKCKKRGGKQLFKFLKHEVKGRGLRRECQVIKTGCTDRCKFGPIVAVMPENKWLLNADEAKALSVLEDTIEKYKNTSS